MDFLDPKKRRQHRITLFIGYALMAVVIFASTLILVLAANGYDIDRKTGSIIQNGLVFVSSHPESSRIYVNGTDKGQTDGRFVLEEGRYTVDLKRAGYRTWTKTLELEGNSVERLVYPFLFPENPVISDVQLYASAPTLVTQSPDRHWIVTNRIDAIKQMEITDANAKDNPTTVVTMPDTAFSSLEGTQKLAVVEWSTDNRHLLLEHSFGDTIEYILFDREDPAASINLTTALGASYANLKLRDKKYDQYYSLDANGLLQAIDLKTKATNQVLTKVKAYKPYQADTILYTTAAGATENKVRAMIHRGSTEYTLRELPVSDVYLMDMAQFNGHDYVVIGAGADSRAYVYMDPISVLSGKAPSTLATKAWLKVSEPATAVSFSGNARFVSLQGGGWFAIYDIENNRQYRYDSGLKTDAANKAEWMDGHRLTVNSEGTLHIFDFDGTNKQKLVPIATGTRAYFDRDYTAIFTVAPSVVVPERTALTRTELLISNQ